MGNIFSSGSSSGGLLGGLTGDLSDGLDFMEHPLDSIMLFVGGIMLLVIVYKIIAD